MAVRKDFLTDANAELIFDNGDLVIGESDQQHIIDTINAVPGWWKEFPIDGVNVIQYQNSAGGSSMLSRKIKIELESDGYIVDNPIIKFGTDGKLNISPNATRN